jgi:ribokinase
LSICVFGIFVADICFFADSIPVAGQTILGDKYIIGPGGKGSNQAIAAARAGGEVSFISKVGSDNYADLAISLYKDTGINYDGLEIDENESTGSAGILINRKTGENAINVVPGAAGTIGKNLIDKNLSIIKHSKIFLTQLETPKDVTLYALKEAKSQNCITILNPAPSREIPDDYFQYVDFFTPNETEASFYLNKLVKNEDDCKVAGNFFLEKGVKNILITLGEKGCYFKNSDEEFLIPASNLNKPVVDTTGAGDAFNGALSVALSQNKTYKQSIEFANLVAGISVTREGAANSMPTKKEIEENIQ